MNQEPKSQEEELDGSDKKPQSARLFKSARECYANARSTAFCSSSGGTALNSKTVDRLINAL